MLLSKEVFSVLFFLIFQFKLMVCLLSWLKLMLVAYICEVFVGRLAYADDLVLLAPTPSAMRRLLQICDE